MKVLLFLLILFFLIRFEIIVLNKHVNFVSIRLPGYHELLTSKFQYTTGGIPKIIIKTSWQPLDRFPYEINQVLQKTMDQNPDYQLYYFSDADVEQFMKDYSMDIYNNYLNLVPGAFKADFFRVCILERFGGCYSDIGNVMIQSFDNILEDYNIVLVEDMKHNIPGIKHIFNAFMCTVPGHPFFKELVNTINQNIVDQNYGENDHDITGPAHVGRIFKKYFGTFQLGSNIYGTTKVRMLHNIFKPLKLRPYTTVVDENGNEVLDTKFLRYYHIMYRASKTPRYPELWKTKKIYKNKNT